MVAGRIDKYDPVDGGFRGALAAAVTAVATPIGVGLNSNGKVVVGAGNTGIKGVLTLTQDKAIGDIVDVMTDGEVLDFSAGAAGTVITANNTTGVLGTAAPDSLRTEVGFCEAAGRLIVRTRGYAAKSDSFVGELAANLAAASTPIAVGIDSAGELVQGVGTTGFIGVVVLATNALDGDIVTVIQDGEMTLAAGTAGALLTALTTTGAIGEDAADATHIVIGYRITTTRARVRAFNPLPVHTHA